MSSSESNQKSHIDRCLMRRSVPSVCESVSLSCEGIITFILAGVILSNVAPFGLRSRARVVPLSFWRWRTRCQGWRLDRRRGGWAHGISTLYFRRHSGERRTIPWHALRKQSSTTEHHNFSHTGAVVHTGVGPKGAVSSVQALKTASSTVRGSLLSRADDVARSGDESDAR